MINLTSKAQEKILEIADSEGMKPIVRVKVLSGGCAGFSHEMEFISIISDTDETVDIDSIKIVMDQMSYLYMDGITVDYIQDGIMGGGFKFSGGDIKSTCACGSSVSYQ